MVYLRNFRNLKKTYLSCLDILNSGNSKGDGYYNISFGGNNITVYCDMTTDGGGWTGIIFNESTDLNYLSQFGSVSEISSTFYSNSDLGIGWGTNDGIWKSIYFNFSFSKVYIVFSGYYNNPSGGMGYLRFNNENMSILSFSDTWTNNDEGQSLYINGTKIYYEAQINEINREEFINVSNSKFINISMKGYTSDYPYTKRYIKKLDLK